MARDNWHPRKRNLSTMLMLSRWSGVISLFFILAVLAGCSRERLAKRAQKLEDQGKYLEAALLYEKLAAYYNSQPGKQSMVEARAGEALLRADQLQEAFSAFDRAATLDNSNWLAHLRLAQLFVAANTPDKAYDHLVAVLNQQPNHIEAMATLGAYYSSLGKLDKAEGELERVLALEPQRQSAAVALADLYSSTGEVSKARDVLLRSARANGNEPVAWMALGRLEEEQGNGDAAEQAYRNAVKVRDDAETNLRLAQHLLRAARVKDAEAVLSRADSKTPHGATWLADFELSSGHRVQATVQYLGVLRARSGNRETSPEAIAAVAARVVEADLDAAASEGLNQSRSKGRTALARLHLDEYRTKVDATTLEVLESEIALVEGDLDQAMQMAKQAVASGPDSAAAYFILGEVYSAKEADAAAVMQWNTALSKDPNYTPAALTLAEVECRQKEYSAAELQAAAVIRREPANLQALLLYARALAGNRSYGAARSILARAMAIARQSAEPHIVLGQIYAKQGRPAVALIEFQEAIVLDPHSREALEGLTSVYRVGHMSRDLIAKLERSADAPPRSSALMEIAGRLYGDHHLYRDAARCFNKALEIDHLRATAAMALAENALAQGQDQAFDQLEGLTGKLGGSADALLQAARAQEENDPGRAISSYEAAIRQGEATGVAANNLAWLYAEKGQSLDRALELAKSAHDHSPQNLAMMDTLGFVYLARHEYSQAVDVLKDAVQLAQTSPIAPEVQTSLRQHLAEAYMRAGVDQFQN